MELRHLRYFIAVAEAGSLTEAAARRLHTAQPSLSRQIRDLELEVGVKLLDRQGARRDADRRPAGCFSTTPGWRCCRSRPRAKPRAASPSRTSPPSSSAFWPARNWCGCRRRCAFCATNSRTPTSRLASQSSPELAGALMRGKVDVAFLRRETEGARAGLQVSRQGAAGRGARRPAIDWRRLKDISAAAISPPRPTFHRPGWRRR